MGYVYISLEETTNNPKPLTTSLDSSYPVIPTIPPENLTMDMMMQDINNLAKSVIYEMRAFLDKPTIKELKKLINNMLQVTHLLAMNDEKLNVLIANSEKASYKIVPLLELTEFVVI